MKKLIWIVLAATMLESGCCTIAAASYDKTWATPVTVPVDVALLPVEFITFEGMMRVATGGSCGIIGFLSAMGGWH